MASLEYFDGDRVAADKFVKKYALRDKRGKLCEETPDDMHKRLAKEFARIDNKFGGGLSEKEYFEVLKDFKRIVPQGSPMHAIGNHFTNTSASNCFVIDAESHGDSISGILMTIAEAAEIMKRRGGVGVDVSVYRPDGSDVNNCAISSTGTASICDAISYFGRYIGQQGRQGALMLTISDRHPDVLRFASMKEDRTKVTGANVSIKVSNELVKAVENDEDWELRWPIAGKPRIKKKIKAKKLWDAIVTQAWQNGEPGILMWDNYCDNLPAHYYPGFRTITTNPCYSGSTRIATQFGLIKIEDLEKNGSAVLATVDNRPRINGTGISLIKSSKAYITSNKEKLYRVALANGMYIDVTSEHNHFIDGGIEKKTRDLVVGDEILLQSDEGQWGIGDVVKESAVAGWLIGNGTTSYKTAHLHFYDEPEAAEYIKLHSDAIIEKHSKSSRPYSGASIREVKMTSGFNQNCQTKKLAIESKVIYNRLKELGFDINVKKLTVPEFVFSANRESVVEFLKTYFSADGSVQYNEEKGCISIRVGSISTELLRGVQMLLINFGIVSSIRKCREAGTVDCEYKTGVKYRTHNRKAFYELIVSGIPHCKKFYDEIGFIINSKNESCDYWFSNHHGSNNTKWSYENSFKSKITSIKYVGNNKTFCLTQPKTNSVVANGIASGNCSEIGLSAYDSCRLISLCLLGYVVNPHTLNAKFNWELFKKDVAIGMRMEDNLVEIETEIVDRILKDLDKDKDDKKLPFSVQRSVWTKIKEAAINGRRTGLGTHGLADCLNALGIAYDKADKIVSKIYKTMRDVAYGASVDLAIERGPFPVFDWELEKDCPFIKRLPKALQKRMEKNGRRNISILTNAPTGTVSLMSRTSSGIEPVYDYVYVRKTKITSDIDQKVHSIDQNGDKWHHYVVLHPEFEKWMKINKVNIKVVQKALIQNDVDGKPRSSSEVIEDFVKLPQCWKVTAPSLKVEDKLRIVSKIQSFVDHGISQTCNFPKGVAKEKVEKYYRDACHSGLKGVTVYVDGSRTGVLVSAGAEKTKKAIDRPKDVECRVHRSNGHVVLIGLIEGEVYEVFAGEKKDLPVPDDVDTAIIRKLESRCYALRWPVTTHTRKTRYAEMPIKESFIKDEGMTVRLLTNLSIRAGVDLEDLVNTIFKSSDLSSFSRHVARILTNYVKVAKSEGCCGDPHIIYEDGCKKCTNCGWSKCS